MMIVLLIFLLIVLFIICKKERLTNVKYKSYNIAGYNELKNKKKYSYTPGGIPKIIIKTSWQTRDKFPLQMINSLKANQKINPDYNIYYFDDNQVLKFMKDFSDLYSNEIGNEIGNKFGNEIGNEIDNIIYNCYNKLVPGAFKADLFRVCCLYKYGGCYSDIGHTCLKPLDEVIGNANIVLVSDVNETGFHGIHNAFMCSTPKHPFFKEIIKKICDNITNDFYGESTLDVTGPECVGKVFNCYFLYKCNVKLENLFVYGTTDYKCDKCNVKILKFHAKDGLPYKISDNSEFIIDAKFKDYYDVMYSNQNTPRYPQLWDQREIYN
jgi:mannosyltransferase OCH1-like enzyme